MIPQPAQILRPKPRSARWPIYSSADTKLTVAAIQSVRSVDRPLRRLLPLPVCCVAYTTTMPTITHATRAPNGTPPIVRTCNKGKHFTQDAQERDRSPMGFANKMCQSVT